MKKECNINCNEKILKGKTVYAFGDSIVYGHTVPEKSFMRLLSADYGISLGMYAVNGATVVTADSGEKEDPNEKTSDNYIINQVKSAPDTAPDVIVFNGYTNDAYGATDKDGHNASGAHINIWEHLGSICESEDGNFDASTFCGGFEKIIYEMRKKWKGVPIIFITAHKSGGRDWETQCKLRELALEICTVQNVYTADIFADTEFDTRDEAQMSEYIIGGAGSHPNEKACRKFYIPIVKNAVIKALKEAYRRIPNNINDTVDVAVFAGQSNMSGRGEAERASVCNENAGFEYKSVSNPDTLVPIIEPFGLDEDRVGGIYDYNSSGTSKRTGSMVSALVNEYYDRTSRQIVAVSASVGGTSTSEWKKIYIHDAVTRLEDTIAFLKANRIGIGRVFVVWSQGETDGDNKVSASKYTENTQYLFELLKKCGAEKCFMIQTGHFRDGGITDEQYAVIRNAQTDLCRDNNDFVMAGSFEEYADCMKDAYHYHQRAYNEVGKAAGRAIAEYYN